MPELLHENLEQQAEIQRKSKKSYLFSPEGKFKQVWNLALMFFLFYTATLMPFKLALIEDEQFGFGWWFDNVVDMFFICDILVNLNSSYYDEDDNVLVTRRSLIIWNYLKFWLPIDFFASIPMNLV
jgi:hypothetical protein